MPNNKTNDVEDVKAKGKKINTSILEVFDFILQWLDLNIAPVIARLVLTAGFVGFVYMELAKVSPHFESVRYGVAIALGAVLLVKDHPKK